MSGALPGAERLVSQARELAGLDDLGDDTWGEGLGRLLASLEAEARLNDVGLQVVMGPAFAEMAANLGRNLQEGRLRIMQAVMAKARAA